MKRYYLFIFCLVLLFELHGQTEFITTWETPAPNSSITIPTKGFGYFYTVDWGDGNITSSHKTDATHVYTNAGNHVVTITGAFPRIFVNNQDPASDRLIEINQWGHQQWTSMERAFYGCTNLTATPSDIPDLSLATDMSYMFANTQSLNYADYNGWDVSGVINMAYLFSNTNNSGNISDWAVDNVENMEGMFQNINISGLSWWEVSKVTNMKSMFTGAIVNSPLNTWDVSNVLDMTEMFAGATFIGGGSVGLGAWDVSRVTSMEGMFSDHNGIAEHISMWDVSNVSNMSKMFYNVTTGPIDSIPDLSMWNVSNVITMNKMFELTAFDQNLSAWNIEQVSNMKDMFLGSNLSAENYDHLLNSWGNQNLQNDVIFSADNTTYCQGTDARLGIVNKFNWTISDGGQTSNCELDFITTWLTNSTNESITIPTEGVGYNYSVNWGDGLTTTGHTGDATHTYSIANQHEIRISGNFPKIHFNNSGDKDKITSIDQWSSNAWTSMASAFSGCTNLIFRTNIPPILSSVSKMDSMFFGASSFNQAVNDWNVSNVTSMKNMFADAISFNKNIGGWDVSNVQHMDGMFDNISLSVETYDSLLIMWNTQNLQSSINFSGGNSRYCNGEFARQNLTDNFSWNISDGGKGMCDFITTWKTTFSGEFVGIPCAPGILYDYDVDWGDGTSTTGHSGNATHAYSNPGLHTVKITGHFPRIYFNNVGHKNKIISIDQWGANIWTSMEAAFWGCSNLDILASDAPNLSIATDMFAMIAGDTTLNADISHWDVSNITNMKALFTGATNFNQDIGIWNVSNVTDMSFMFQLAEQFNHNIENWNVSEVMFMNSMFRGAGNFNKELGAWNVGDVSNMNFMFFGADSFNQPINTWDVSQVQSMKQIFREASVFNQDIASWNLLNLTDASGMFWNATSFNQDISGWHIDSVVNMSSMFNGATLFDQNIGDWNVTSVTNMNGLFDNTELSIKNYDSLLIGWSALNLIPGINFSGGSSQYCNGDSARQHIIDLYNWNITDGNKGNCEFITIWRTTTPNETIEIPCASDVLYNFTVDWGDGSVSTGLTDNATHEYDTAGIYEIKITGLFPRIYFNNGGDNQKIRAVDQWGGITWSSMHGAFYGCSNMVLNTIDPPDLSGLTSLYAMFAGCSSMNSPSLINWDVSNVEIFASMFVAATSFDQNIGSWDVSNATDISFMFQQAGQFNQDIGNWDISNVTTTRSMFRDAVNFNQDIGNWDVDQVQFMNFMFLNAHAFNQPLDNWDVSEVRTMKQLFRNALEFNQDLTSWNVVNVVDMTSMFHDANKFNQDIGNWNISNVTNMENMFKGVTLNTTNYDSLLIGWQTQSLQPNVNFHGGNSMYCEGQAARLRMINENGWNITDGGGDDLGTCCPLELYAGSSPISDGIYTASETITADKLIPFTGVVTFKAGNEVFLNAEFEVKSGAEFEIILDDCSN